MPFKMRGHRCVLCRRNKNDCGSLMLHRFPKDVARCKTWVEALNLPILERVPPSRLNHSYVICSDHFRDDQYLNGRLLYNSVPVQNLTPVDQGDSSDETSDSDERASFIPKKEPPVVGVLDNNLPFGGTDWTFHDFPRGCYDKSAHASDEVRMGPSFSQGTGTMGRSSPVFIGPDVPGTSVDYKIEPGTTFQMPYDSVSGKSLDFIDTFPATVENETRNVTDSTIKSIGYDFSLKLVKKDGTVIRVPEERALCVSRNPCVTSFIQKCLKKPKSCKKSHSSRRRNLFALSAYSKNPKAYKYLKEMFGLPPIKMMRQWKKTIISDYGFWSSYIHSFLERRALSMNEEEKLCGILFHVFKIQDDAAKKTNLPCEEVLNQSSTNEQNSNINENLDSFVNHVLVLVVKSFNKTWNYVVGVHRLGSCIKASYVKQILEECIVKLQGIRLDVKFMLSMYVPLNYSVKELFGITPDEPYIIVREKKVYVLCEPQALILDTLKAFSKNNIYTGNGLAKWDYVHRFLEKDSQQDISMGPNLGLVLETLTMGRSFDNCSKDTSQVFSQAVASGIYIYTTLDVLPQEAVHTAEFIFTFSKLINCFLDSKPLSKSQEKTYIDHIRFLESLKSGIFMCRFVSKTNEQSSDSCSADNQCFLSWKSNVNALLQMWKELFNNHKISHIQVQKLCQTHVDDLHKLICKDKGQSELTSLQFERAIKKILFKSLRQTSYLEDCESFICQNP
ncbi:uncharacterized protein LOC135214983 isoform X2 [Macrobrachium nipponense]|uniref:uncharacterized protein LOC135214983 isoform X2 n=1 Tax=Macrobrachium nipponense TaxID=159736 RepID=UPI0030C89470